jgi:hypothetical protein
VEIRVSKERVTSIFGFETEEHDNALRRYGDFMVGCQTQNKEEIRAKTRANINGVVEM